MLSGLSGLGMVKAGRVIYGCYEDCKSKKGQGMLYYEG